MRRLLFSALLVIGGGATAFLFVTPVIEAGGGGYGGACGPPRDGTDEPVVIKGNCFTPEVLYVQPGDTVEWRHEGGKTPHNVTLFDGTLVGGDGNLLGGERVSYTFSSAGLYAYYCTIHPSMLGVVAVGDPGSEAFGASLSVQKPEVVTVRSGRNVAVAGLATGSEDSPAALQAETPTASGAWDLPAAGLAIGALATGVVLAAGGFAISLRK